MGLQYDAYLVVALLEDGELLALLRDIAGILERVDREVLADGVHVGDAGAHIARGLRLERLELVGRRPLEREAHEADAHAPDVVLLRRAVELDGKDVAVQVGELREKRLLVDALLVDEPEVCVVAYDDDLLALRRRGPHGGDDSFRVRERRRVAGRVVREVEDEDLLRAGREERLLHRLRVECAAAEGVEVDDPAADRLLEDEFVVVPVEIGADKRVARTSEELRADADAVRERVRDDGVGERLALERGVLGELHRAPHLAKLWKAEAPGIEERALVEPDRLSEAVHHERRAVLLEGHADRCVDFAGLRLGPLAKYPAVGEIHAPSGGREKFGRRAERLVKFKRQLVHVGRILYQKGTGAGTMSRVRLFPAPEKRVTAPERSRRRRSPST